MDLSELQPGQTHRHPWETARAAFVRRELAGERLLERPVRVLDVGAGDAFVSAELLAALPAGSEAVCWDTAYASDLAARPGLRFTRERPAERFDLVLLLDVLEHVEDDRGLLSALASENLAPGGLVLLSVPAWPQLFTSHDVRLKHVRRYTPAAGAALLEGAGLVPVRHGGLFHSLLPARAAQKALQTLGLSRAVPAAGDWRGGALVTRVLEAALDFDGRLSSRLAARGLEVPGLSWWALCRKR